MEPDQGHADRPEASLLSRRQYLLSTGAIASSAAVGAAATPAAAAADAVAEVGTASASHEWADVSVTNSYSDPVAVAPTLSYQGPHPASPRVREVTGDGFDVRVEEWRYLDGWHRTESVGYLAGEAGAHATAGGTRFELGRVRTDHRWSAVSFDADFSVPPIVFSNAQTRNGAHPVVTRTKDVSASGMRVRLQEEEAEGPHLEETVGYLAIEAGIGDLNGRGFEAGIQRNVDDGWQTVAFYGSYERPTFLADTQTTRGDNTATVRYRNLTGSSVQVKIEEEQSRDQETSHVGETVGYLVVEGAPTATAADESGYGMGGYGAGGYGQ